MDSSPLADIAVLVALLIALALSAYVTAFNPVGPASMAAMFVFACGALLTHGAAATALVWRAKQSRRFPWPLCAQAAALAHHVMLWGGGDLVDAAGAALSAILAFAYTLWFVSQRPR